MNCTVILTEKGRLAKWLQLHLGDLFISLLRDGTIRSIEVKSDYRDDTGNIFLETWSNWLVRHGWLFHLRADVLWYYFPHTKRLYSIYLPELKKWAFSDWFLFKNFREKSQKRYGQQNDTRGIAVPIGVLQQSLGRYMKNTTLPIGPNELANLLNFGEDRNDESCVVYNF